MNTQQERATTDTPDGARSVLTTEHVRHVLAQATPLTRPASPYLQLLRWLVWLPLLSSWELARMMRKDEKTVWGYLARIEQFDLAAHIVLSEPGWPRRHRRHYITDLGLYVLVACYPHPLSVPKLAASYAIEQRDLLARLARPQVHLVLSDLVSRLLSELPTGYQLTSYQQPWRQAYRWQGKKRTFGADAALLLQTPTGTEHALYVRVDQPERMFSQRQEQAYLSKLFELRQATHLRQDVMPHLLLLSTPARFSFWAEQLEQSALARGSAVLSGAIADFGQLQAGMCAPIWLPFRELITQLNTQADEPHTQERPAPQPRSLFSLLDQPATPQLIERFSQRSSFQHLFTRRESGPLARRRKKLTRYVFDSLQREAAQFMQMALQERPRAIVQLRERLYSARHERTCMAALLTLALSSQQKALLALLARHPLLSLPDLLVHLHPESTDARPMQQQLKQLCGLGLVRLFTWEGSGPWRESERYELSEAALRFLAMRHGVPPAHYLYPVTEEPDRRKISPLDPTLRWVQRGIEGLRAQMSHTNELYRCIRHIVAAGRRTGSYAIVFWKSARESVRSYHDSSERYSGRPDAELLYTLPGSTAVRHLLIEYDRGTTFAREYQDKFAAYSDYQHDMRTVLPRIVMITPNQRAAERILRSIRQAHAQDVQVTIVLEQDVLQRGLLPVLGVQGHPQGTEET